MLLHSVRDIFWKEEGIVLFQEQLSNFSGGKIWSAEQVRQKVEKRTRRSR